MSLRINHEKLLEKCRTNCTKIEHLLNFLKIKIKKILNLMLYLFIMIDINLPEDGAACESFTIVSIDSLLAYENKYYLQVYYLQKWCDINDIKDDGKFYKQIF